LLLANRKLHPAFAFYSAFPLHHKITSLNIIFYKIRSMDAEKGLVIHIMDDGMSSKHGCFIR
jgi:hypothetical protein